MKRAAIRPNPLAVQVIAFVSVACLTLLLLPAAGFGSDPEYGANLLRPPDTSSPRDTLNGFLADTNEFIKAYRKHKKGTRGYRALVRASQVLDFSTTPDGDSWFVRQRRVAFLQELLARIELPPANKIPGDEDVTNGAITHWSIPNTEITIARITEGPRAGEFLFSAKTVQNLDRLYRQAKHLPYRPGATHGIYEEVLRATSGVLAQEHRVRNLLKPVDTSSPRATVEDFLDNVNRAYELVSQANDALDASPPRMTYEEARTVEATAANLLQRASDSLDLRQIPDAFRKVVGIEATLQLKEVLDRTLLPPIDVIPTRQMVETAGKQAPPLAPETRRPFQWRWPNTNISIVEVPNGERQGQFLFSADTVRRIGDTYKKAKDLPYRQPEFGGVELEYISPGLSPDFYKNYILASGYLVPHAHFLGRFVDTLPGWFKVELGRQMVWQWAGLLLFVTLTALIAYLAYRRITQIATRIKSPWKEWLRLAAAVVILGLLWGMGRFMGRSLRFTSDVQALLTSAIATTLYVLAAWAIFALFKAVAETIIATPRVRKMTSEAALLRIGARVIGSLTAVWIVIVGIRSLGADLIPLLAGLGIGGLAVALAAQSTIANFIGGLILLANKPVQIGDFCRYGTSDSADWLPIGTVEEINWLSTRIRGIDRTVTTIPNAEFVNLQIVNLTRRDQRLVRTTLQLRYETTPDQLRFILIKLRELLLGHPKVTPDPARVRFVGYGPYSKDIEIFCYLACREQNEFLAIQEDLLLRIENIIKAAGSGFAFPSQTTYITNDAGLDTDRGQEAETHVEHLRFTGKLPFPEFDEEERDQLEDLLDYPPKGSPKYRQPSDGHNPESGN